MKRLDVRLRDDGCVIYADPPYIVKGEAYVHDFETADHERLAAALQRFRRTRVVVSYYAHPDLAGLYPGWSVLDCSVRKYLVNSGKQTAGTLTTAPEVLLINGPIFGDEAPKPSSLFDAIPEETPCDT